MNDCSYHTLKIYFEHQNFVFPSNASGRTNTNPMHPKKMLALVTMTLCAGPAITSRENTDIVREERMCVYFAQGGTGRGQ